jgi:hypothetical protein
LLGALETLLGDAKFIKHNHRALFVSFFLILKIFLQLGEVLFVVFHEVLLSLLLGVLFNFLVLQFGEVTSVLKDPNKAVLF